MNKHETKNCPRCNGPFECKAGSIMLCQCSGIILTAKERAFIESKYTDCLCIHCLHKLREEYLYFREKYIFNE